jgi:hypothetical protein
MAHGRSMSRGPRIRHSKHVLAPDRVGGNFAADYLSVAEVDPFYTAARNIWDEDEIHEIVSHVARNPEGGELIVGTGGLRKLRWAAAGNKRGKSGGARIIYLPGSDDMPAYLLNVYTKSKQANLTPAQTKLAGKAVETLKAAYRGKRQQRVRQ